MWPAKSASTVLLQRETYRCADDVEQEVVEVLPTKAHIPYKSELYTVVGVQEYSR